MRLQEPGRLAAIICLLGLLWLPFMPTGWAAAPVEIQSVTAVVQADAALPLPVQQRMEKSVQAIGEQLLEGKSQEDVRQSQKQYEDIILQVFDKVLVGYTVGAVRLEPGADTCVHVVLLPWQDKINQVHTSVTVEGMSPELAQLLYQDVAGMEEIFANSLQGLPVAAVDWTHGLLKKQVNGFMQQHAPEFRADFDVEVAEYTKVNVVLYPLLPVVRTVDLSMHSDTMLNAGLLLWRDKMQTRVDQLIGLPVPFVARHRQEMENYLGNILNQDKVFQDWDMTTQVAIAPGEKLTVMSRTDSNTYRIRLEGRGDIGNSHGNREETSLQARLHIGRKLSNRDEIFARFNVYPQSMKWDWSLGYGYQLPTGTELNLLYSMRHTAIGVEAQQRLVDKFYLRYAYRPEDHHNEYALGYRLHDFLAVEYARDSHNSWLRFIGYF